MARTLFFPTTTSDLPLDTLLTLLGDDCGVAIRKELASSNSGRQLYDELIGPNSIECTKEALRDLAALLAMATELGAVIRTHPPPRLRALNLPS